MSGTTAATLLHCGPGLANGLANLHNARKARTSILNIVGDQAQFHGYLDPPLASNTEAFAQTVSGWTRRSNSSLTVGADAAAAIAQARFGGGAIATLILPSDVCWGPGGPVGAPPPVPARSVVSEDAIRAVHDLLRGGKRTAIVLGDDALTERCLRLAHAIGAKSGARVLAHSFIRRIERGGDRPAILRVPYAVAPARAMFADIDAIVLVATARPVFAFAGPDGLSGPEAEGTQFMVLGSPGDDVEAALGTLCTRLAAAPDTSDATPRAAGRPEVATGPITPDAFGQSLAALLPHDAIVVDEGISFGRSVFAATQHAPRHDWLQLTGGAIGCGMPLAIGAAVAAPRRRVITLQADGSGLYSVQALWTQARERLDVTTIVFSNRSYEILFNETRRMGLTPGASAERMFSLDDPAMDWVRLANGFGVEAASAASMDELNGLLAAALARPGPFLIELLL
jgi:acetolactate synthase-1/2/3 large subunit